MTNLIVTFSKPSDAKCIRNILVQNGFPVTVVCNSGANTLQYADELHSGIVICGYRMTDMLYRQLRENLSSQFDMLLLASMKYADEIDTSDVTYVSMPLKVHDLVVCLNGLISKNEIRKRKEKQQPKVRNSLDREVIQQAKKLLMDTKGMTEEQAHRYLQKCSMDNGVNMIETSQMVIAVMK